MIFLSPDFWPVWAALYICALFFCAAMYAHLPFKHTDIKKVGLISLIMMVPFTLFYFQLLSYLNINFETSITVITLLFAGTCFSLIVFMKLLSFEILSKFRLIIGLSLFAYGYYFLLA